MLVQFKYKLIKRKKVDHVQILAEYKYLDFDKLNKKLTVSNDSKKIKSGHLWRLIVLSNYLEKNKSYFKF